LSGPTVSAVLLVVTAYFGQINEDDDDDGDDLVLFVACCEA